MKVNLFGPNFAEKRYAWAYALTRNGLSVHIFNGLKTHWGAHAPEVDWILRSTPLAFRQRHHPELGRYARAVVRAAFQALKAFDPDAPDLGASKFELLFHRWRGERGAFSTKVNAIRADPLIRQQGKKKLSSKTQFILSVVAANPQKTDREIADIIYDDAPRFDDGEACFFWIGTKFYERDKPHEPLRFERLRARIPKARKHLSKRNVGRHS